MAVIASKDSEYRDALRSARWAKSLFWVIVGVALVIALAAFVVVQIRPQLVGVGINEYYQQLIERNAETADARMDTLRQWSGRLATALNWARLLSFMAAVLLALSLLLAVQISLAGNLGGAGRFTSSFLWSLILLALLVPWGGWAQGAVYSLSELGSATRIVAGEDVSFGQRLAHYGQFGVYPLAALVVWLIVQVKFIRGLHRVKVAPETVVAAPQFAPRPAPQPVPPKPAEPYAAPSRPAEPRPAEPRPTEPKPVDERPRPDAPGENAAGKNDPPIPLE